MPFRSSQQRRLFYALRNEGKMDQATIDEWNAETPKKKLPRYIRKKKPAHEKKADTMSEAQTLFTQAFHGALAGAIAGSRRSLDNKMLQGVAQGAAIGALGGVLGGQATGHEAGTLIGGGLAGAIASRGPRGKSRPQLHFRLDRGEKTAQRRVVGGKHVTVPDGVIPGPSTSRIPKGEWPKSKWNIQDAKFSSPKNRRLGLGAALLAAGAGAGLYALDRHDKKRREQQKTAESAFGPQPGPPSSKATEAKRVAYLESFMATKAVGLSDQERADRNKKMRKLYQDYTGSLSGPPPKGVRGLIRKFTSKTASELREQAAGRQYWLKRMMEKRRATMAAKAGEKTAELTPEQRKANLYKQVRKNIANGKHWSCVPSGSKTANHAAELAGLAVLAAPSAAELAGKHVSEKTKHKAELAGLGILAAPSAIHLASGAGHKLQGIAKALFKRKS